MDLLIINKNHTCELQLGLRELHHQLNTNHVMSICNMQDIVPVSVTMLKMKDIILLFKKRITLNPDIITMYLIWYKQMTDFYRPLKIEL